MEINSVRQTRIITALITLVILTACSSAAEPSNPSLPTILPPTDNSTVINEFCDNPLFPVKQGASWTYFSTGGPNDDFSYTDTITAILPDGFVLTS